MKAFQYCDNCWARTSEVVQFGPRHGTTSVNRTFWFALKGDERTEVNEHYVSKEYAVQFQSAILEEFGVFL